MAKETIVRLFTMLRQNYYNFRIMLYELLTDTEIEGNPQKIQPCVFTGPGRFIFGDNVFLGCLPSPYYWSTYCSFDTRTINAVIRIGSKVRINNNLHCCAFGEISIGDSTLIGANVVIMDCDGHEINPTSRDSSCGQQANIAIGQNVWIGSNVMILKGVTIGDNSIIGAGSVVTKPIPSNVIAAGNPCRVLKEIGSQIKQN